jgi:hypothetical protein
VWSRDQETWSPPVTTSFSLFCQTPLPTNHPTCTENPSRGNVSSPLLVMVTRLALL